MFALSSNFHNRTKAKNQVVMTRTEKKKKFSLFDCRPLFEWQTLLVALRSISDQVLIWVNSCSRVWRCSILRWKKHDLMSKVIFWLKLQIGLFRGSFALLPPSSPSFHFVGLCARQGKVSFYLIARLAAGSYGTFRNDCAINNFFKGFY